MLYRYLKVFALSIFLVLALALLPSRSAAAQETPERVTITGPGLSEPLVVSDPDQLASFTFGRFENPDQVAPLPEDTGRAYTITRYRMVSESVVAWDRLLYLPANESQAAHVFYEGILVPGVQTALAEQWYAVSPAGQDTMQEVIAAASIPVTGEATRNPFLVVPNLPAFLLIVALVILTLGVIVFVQRRTSQ